jgi:2-haloacid dehalogenase
VAGLVPAIHVFLLRIIQDVDARDKRGHDEGQPSLACDTPQYQDGDISGVKGKAARRIANEETNMFVNRRDFVTLAGGGAVAAIAGMPADGAQTKIRAVAFDGFPIIDPRPVFAKAEEIFPGSGLKLGDAWRTRQFEYTWLRTLGGHYADFWQVTEESLVFAARALAIDLSADQRDQLMQAWLTLKAWPDVAPALKALKAAGIRMAFLSNLTDAMLDSAVKNSALEGSFEPHLSTDRVRAFKPDPRAYQMGLDAFQLKKEEIAFAAFAGWDAAGAKWFGYPTFWVNRLNAPVEELSVVPDGVGSGLGDFVKFVLA